MVLVSQTSCGLVISDHYIFAYRQRHSEFLGLVFGDYIEKIEAIWRSLVVMQIADEGFDGVHQENVILENIPKEKILGKLSPEEAKAGAAAATFEAPPIDSILNLYDMEQVLAYFISFFCTPVTVY